MQICVDMYILCRLFYAKDEHTLEEAPASATYNNNNTDRYVFIISNLCVISVQCWEQVSISFFPMVLDYYLNLNVPTYLII